LWATVATDLSYVAGVGLPRFTRYGAWITTRTPCSAEASRNASSLAGLLLDGAQPRGLPAKIWSTSAPIVAAFGSISSTSPLPTLTWVPTGFLRAGRTAGGDAGGMSARLASGMPGTESVRSIRHTM
jgi:hypothetical protein